MIRLRYELTSIWKDDRAGQVCAERLSHCFRDPPVKTPMAGRGPAHLEKTGQNAVGSPSERRNGIEQTARASGFPPGCLLPRRSPRVLPGVICPADTHVS